MKTVFGALYKRDSSVLATLSNPRLFELNQRRHIIVHRLGIVDEEYIRRSKDNLQVGSQLLVKASDLSRYLDAVRDAGISLLEAGFVALKEVDA